MEKKKILSYSEGYSQSDILKKITAATSAVLLCGSLAACRKEEEPLTLMGEEEYLPDVSETDFSAPDETLSLMGEEEYFPLGEDSPVD